MPGPDKPPSRKFLFRCIRLCFWIFVVGWLIKGIACGPTASEKDSQASTHLWFGMMHLDSDIKSVSAGKIEFSIEKAIERFTKAINLVPNDVIAHCYRADAYAAIKEYEKAISDYSKAIQLAPVIPKNRYVRTKIYTGRGKAHKELGNDTKADADFMKAREIEANIKSKP